MMRHVLVALGIAVASKPAPAAQAIPLREGLVLTYVHRNFNQGMDSELKVWVVRVTDSETVFTAEFTHLLGTGRPRFEERMSRRELLGARNLDYGRGGQPASTPERRPHTLFMLSQRLLQRLKRGETVDFIMPFVQAPGNAVPLQGTLRAVPPTPTTLDVLIDGETRALPAVQAEGTFERLTGSGGVRQRIWFLDDSLTPWVLRDDSVLLSDNSKFAMSLGSAITSPAEEAKYIARSLRDGCRARVYGFYFAFGRADLDPLSAPTFAEVAAMLKSNPLWTVTVEGHTDSIGNPEANRKLSDRRAAAVRQELVTKYGIAAARLTSAGAGATKPVAPNGTLEGRARNRRVDLVRPCGG